MIKLFQFPPAFGLPFSVSQFCAKVELYCRLTGREYELVVGDPRKSPNHQLPYVEWPDGRITAESAGIIAELEKQGSALDQDLSGKDVETGKRLRALAEGPVYFACLYARFVEEDGWVHQKPTIKALVPGIIAPLLVPMIRRSQIKRCARNGFAGRDGYATANEAIAKLSDALGDKKFMLGDDIQTVDCAVWSGLVQVSQTWAANPSRNAVRNDARLMAYIERVATAADWELPPLK